MNRLTSILLSVALVATPINAHASPPADDVVDVGTARVTALEEGEPAPFNGTLLSDHAAAKIVADKKLANEQCKIERERDVAVALAEKQLELDNVKITLDAEKKRRVLQKQIADERTKMLSTDLERAQKQAAGSKWGPLYFVGGAALGVLVVLAGAYIVKEVK